MTDFDPAVGAIGLEDWRRRAQQRGSIEATLGSLDPRNIEQFARMNPSAGPDLTASVALSGTRWDDPTLSQIIAADARKQSMLQQGLTRVMGPITRPATMLWESAYKAGVSTPYNTFTRVLQGESLQDAIMNSGYTPISLAFLAERSGQDWTMGQGLIAGMQPDPMMAPGAGEFLQERMDEGMPIEDALTATERWVMSEYGWDVMNLSHQTYETTMVHQTVNGVDYTYHATPGRVWAAPLVAAQIIRPQTAPYSALTGAIDVFHQVALDPMDPVFDELTLYARNRRIAAYSQSIQDMSPDEVARQLGAVPINYGQVQPGQTRASGFDTGTRVEGLLFHGGGALTDEFVNAGGIASDPKLARGYADAPFTEFDEVADDWVSVPLPDGQVHVIKVEDLPPELQSIVENSPTGTVEAFWGRESLAEMYPEYAVEDVLRHQQEYLEAHRTYYNLNTRLKGLVPDINERGAILELIEREITMEHGTDVLNTADVLVNDENIDLLFEGLVHSTSSLKEYYNMARTFDPETIDGIIAAIDEAYEARKVMLTDDLFGDLKDVPYPSVQYRDYHAQDPADIMWGGETYRPRVSASYTVDEWDEMVETGYVFPERHQWEQYKSHKATEAEVVETVRGRPWITPQTWEKFKARKSLVPGKPTDAELLMHWTARSGITDIASMFPAMAGDTVKELARLGMDDLSEIDAIIGRYWGSAASGGKMPAANLRMRTARRAEEYLNTRDALVHSSTEGPMGAMSYMPRTAGRAFKWGQRQFAAMGSHVVDPSDWRATLDLVRSWGETLGRGWDEIEDLAKIVIDMDGSRKSGKPVVGKLFEWLSESLVKEGYTADEVSVILSEWSQALDKQHKYSLSAGGEMMPNYYGSKIEINTKYGTVTFPVEDPVMMSELASRNFFMPDIRQVRRATSRLRRVNDIGTNTGLDFLDDITSRKSRKGREAKGGLPGLSTSMSQHRVDQALATWRNMALLRGGWPLRILPDELARWYMSPYSDTFRNPLDILLYSMGHKGDLTGEMNFRKVIDELGLGEDNGMFRTVLGDESDLPRTATNVRGANWFITDKVVAETTEGGNWVTNAAGGYTLTPEAAKGLAREYMQLHFDPLLKALGDHATVDDALAFLLDTTDGKKIISQLRRLADPESSLGRAASFDHPERLDALRAAVERLDAMRHQITGGHWIARNPEKLDEWIDMNGKRVNTYQTESVQELQALAENHPSGPLRGPNGGILRTKKQLRDALFEADGVPKDIMSLPGSQKYYITKQGDRELLDLLHHGRTQDVPSVQRARRYAVRDLYRSLNPKLANDDVVYVVLNEAQELTPSQPFLAGKRGYYSLEEAVAKRKAGDSIIPVHKDALGGAPARGTGRYVDIEGNIPVESRGATLKSDRIDELTAMKLDEADVPYLHEDMSIAEIEELESKLSTAYNPDRPPPAHVRYPDKALDDLDAMGATDRLFQVLGANPSKYTVRLPFAHINHWENVGHMYIHATPAVRAQLLKMAEEANMSSEFTTMIEKALRQRGMKKPMTGQELLSAEEIWNLAGQQAINNAKELFYDLSKGGNWQDAMRIVFPFADAWWEIISRWANLANPVKQGGKPLKGLRRIQQLNQGAERSGYMDTNTQGERVFNMPLSAGAMFNVIGPGMPGVEVMPQVSPDQLLFVNFSNPAELLAPGMSVQAQLTAAALRPLLPDEWRKGFDQFVFGDFGAPQIDDVGDLAQQFLPTWIRRFLDKIFNSEETDEKFARMQVSFVNGAAQLPQYGDLLTNPETQARIRQDTKKMASWIASMDVLGAWVAPAQASNRIGLMGTDEKGLEKIKDQASIYADWSMLRNAYGEDEALMIMHEWYGIDPLKMTSSNWTVTPTPVTRSQFDAYQANPDLDNYMPYTLTAWLPEVEGEPFYAEAWHHAKETGKVEVVTAVDATTLMSQRAGSYRLRKVREARDDALLKAEQQYGGKDNDLYRQYRDGVVEPWYNQERLNINAQYYHYSPNSPAAGLTARPSYSIVVKELSAIADPSTQAYDLARKMDPALHDFVIYTVGMWDNLNQASVDSGRSFQWWNRSDAQSGEAARVREAFVNNMRWKLSQMPTSSHPKAEWIATTIFQPLLEGFDIENPIVIAANSIPLPTNEFSGGI